MTFDVEQFFQSVDIILTQRLNDLSFDKTVVMTITDDSDKSRGHYVVSNGTLEFDAYSTDTEYNKDDQVRITILNNDWSQKKFIAGKYIQGENTSDPIKYIPPLGTIMKNNQSSLTQEKDKSKIRDYTLYTNGSQKEQYIWNTVIDKDSEYYTLQANGIYNTLALSADFLTNFEALQGNYGIRLDLFISPSLDSNERIQKIFTFDSSEMVGNPYSYVIDSYQSKQILIASEGIVTELIMYIYQGQNYEIENDTLVVKDNPFIGYDQQVITEQHPIQFKNITLGFGSDLTKIEDNSLQIYSLDSATYHYADGAGDNTNDKRIGLVWYNKNEENEYIGFSDGIIELDNDNKIQPYEELQYLITKNVDSRLAKNKNKEGIPNDEQSLGIYADLEESTEPMKQAYYTLAGDVHGAVDLIRLLQSMGNSLGNTSMLEELNQLIRPYYNSAGTQQNAKLAVQADLAKVALDRLLTRYQSVLRYGYETQHEITERAIENWSNVWVDPDGPTASGFTANDTSPNKRYILQYKTAIEAGVKLITDYMTKLDQQTQPGYSLAGFRGVYDSYANRINNGVKYINQQLSAIKITQEHENTLLLYKDYTKDDFKPYGEVDLTPYDNRYCIYWYRYNEKLTLDPLSDEYKHGRFLGDKWELVKIHNLTPEADGNVRFDSAINLGLPTTVGRTENVLSEDETTVITTMYFPEHPGEPQILQRKMDPYLPEERYQAVLFYNHQMIKSNVLTFKNTEAELIPKEFAVDAADVLVIEHKANSQDHYQSYSSAYDLLNISDEGKSRQLKVSYDGVLVDDEALAGAGIYWYVPTDATMITYDLDYLVNTLGFTTDASPMFLTLAKVSGQTNTYKYAESLAESVSFENARIGKILIKEHIPENSWIVVEEALPSSTNKKYEITGAMTKTEYSKNGYVYFYKRIDYKENEIDAKDVDGNPIYNADGTAAKDKEIVLNDEDRYFSYKIKPFYNPGAQNNTILVEAHVHGSRGEEKITSGSMFLTFSTFGSNGTKYTLTITPAARQTAVLPEASLDVNLTLRNADNEELPMSLESVESEGFYGLTTKWHARHAPSKSTNIGSYQTSGIVINDIENSVVKNANISNATDENKYCGILSAKVSFLAKEEEEEAGEESATLDTGRRITLNTLYAVPYSQNPEYYISGPTHIVYNNQGVLSRLSEEPFKLYLKYQINDDGQVIENVVVDNQVWTLLYYDNSGKLVGADDPALGYMPTLNSDNTLMPAPMYYQYDEGTKFYVPVAQCKIGDVIAWTQPIIITQNQYASSTLNDWNGQFEINEANGTILSTMLGAGKKNADNTFNGVLIGDIEAGANFDHDNARGIGIYGFDHGAQSFNFGIDGKAFLGKAGHGRIMFDGNSGTISSASYQQNRIPIYEDGEDGNPVLVGYEDKGLAGMKIDLDDGHIDMLGSVRTKDSEYAPLNYQFFRIYDIDATQVESNVVDRDIAQLRYENTWYEENGKAMTSNIFVTDEGYEWSISNIKYSTKPDTKEATYVQMKYPSGADIKNKEHRKIYRGPSSGYAEVDFSKSVSSSSTYYLMVHQAHDVKYIIPNELTLISNSEYAIVEYVDAEAFNNDTRDKYTRSGNSTQGYTYTPATSWRANRTYYVKILELTDDYEISGSLTFNYEYDEYFDLDLTAETYEFYKEKDFTTLYYLNSENKFEAWTYSGDYVGQTFYAKIRREFSIIIPEGAYKSERIVEDSRRSHVHLDVLNPYLTISSAKQADDEYIMYVGDNNYYLQSVNYAPGMVDKTINNVDGWDGAPFHADGAGMKMDLNSGHIDAYDFTLTSKNIFLDSGNKANPFMIVRDNLGKVLIYMGTNNYFLQSSDFRPMNKNTKVLGSGMKLDLVQGKLEAYGFNLRAGQTDSGDHEIIITDDGSGTNPYLQINTTDPADSSKTKTLVEISKGKQYFQSEDYAEPKITATSYENGAGIKLSLSDKELKAYSGFSLLAQKTDGGGSAPNNFVGISIDSTVNDYPFQIIGTDSTSYVSGYKNDGSEIYSSSKNSFKVNWNGTMSAVGGTFTGTINASSGVLNNLTVNGTLTGGTISGATIVGGVLKIGPTASTKGYQLYANSSCVYIENATINNCTIGNNPGGSGNGTVYIDQANGKLTATNGELDNLLVKRKLTVETVGTSSVATYGMRRLVNQAAFDGGGGVAQEAALVDIKGTTYIEGDTTINGTTVIGGTLDLTGSTKISGHVGIGMASDDDASLVTSGKSIFGGDITYTGNIHCVADDTKTYDGQTTVVQFLSFLKNRKLKFINGILVAVDDKVSIDQSDADESLASVSSVNKDYFLQSTGDGTVWTQLGDLAFKDTVTLSNATFKLGSSTATTVTPVISGNTATITVTIPGQKYAGSTTSGHWVKVYANKDLPSDIEIGGYEDKGIGWKHVGSVWADGETADGGTTEARTGVFKITVTAEED